MQRQKLSAPYREKDRRCFGIKHYAGDVIYDVVDFVEKNKDEMLPNLTELVLSSRNDFIRDVLFAAAAAAAAAVSGMSHPQHARFWRLEIIAHTVLCEQQRRRRRQSALIHSGQHSYRRLRVYACVVCKQH